MLFVLFCVKVESLCLFIVLIFGKFRSAIAPFFRNKMVFITNCVRRRVSRVLSHTVPKLGRYGDDHSSGTVVANRLLRPTRTAARKQSLRPCQNTSARRPYSVVLLAGLAVPFLSPGTRCALTAPFHPYRAPAPKGLSVWRFDFCGAIPRVTPAGRCPAPCLRGARTFLPSSFPRHRQRDRPAV